MIELEGISKIYNRGKENEFYALKHVNLRIEDGEMVAIVGKSGAGKSTDFPADRNKESLLPEP